jgi:acyl-coenzyme A thioesterase PaaI-like protein
VTASGRVPGPVEGSAPLTDDKRCFACGPENPNGLHMVFEYGDGTARCTVVPSRDFGGWSTIMHGGVVATLLDEAMAHAAIGAGVRAVTARIEVRFRKPVPTERTLIAEGVVRGRRGRVLEIDGTLSGEDGTLFAESHARFIAEIPGDQARSG